MPKMSNVERVKFTLVNGMTPEDYQEEMFKKFIELNEPQMFSKYAELYDKLNFTAKDYLYDAYMKALKKAEQ